LAAKTLFIFSTIRQDSCHFSLFRLFGGDFANVFELTNRKGKNGSWRKSPSGSNDCAPRAKSSQSSNPTPSASESPKQRNSRFGSRIARVHGAFGGKSPAEKYNSATTHGNLAAFSRFRFFEGDFDGNCRVDPGSLSHQSRRLPWISVRLNFRSPQNVR
jgi:hypothetical protein